MLQRLVLSLNVSVASERVCSGQDGTLAITTSVLKIHAHPAKTVQTYLNLLLIYSRSLVITSRSPA